MRQAPAILLLGATLALSPSLAHAKQVGWSALASDRNAQGVGDSLTVVIYESASASNVARSGNRKKTNLGAQAAGARARPQGGALSLSSDFEGDGHSGRSDTLVAQISVQVVEILANGDLRVDGAQDLEVNGERTRIRVRGRVRPTDISGSNTVPSTRMAQAQIEYNGAGFVAGSTRPGLIPRIAGKLGLF